jgi:hypothetical protein
MGAQEVADLQGIAGQIQTAIGNLQSAAGALNRLVSGNPGSPIGGIDVPAGMLTGGFVALGSSLDELVRAVMKLAQNESGQGRLEALEATLATVHTKVADLEARG